MLVLAVAPGVAFANVMTVLPPTQNVTANGGGSSGTPGGVGPDSTSGNPNVVCWGTVSIWNVHGSNPSANIDQTGDCNNVIDAMALNADLYIGNNLAASTGIWGTYTDYGFVIATSNCGYLCGVAKWTASTVQNYGLLPLEGVWTSMYPQRSCTGIGTPIMSCYWHYGPWNF